MKPQQCGKAEIFTFSPTFTGFLYKNISWIYADVKEHEVRKIQ